LSKVQYWQIIDTPNSYCFYKDICPSPITAANAAPIGILFWAPS